VAAEQRRRARGNSDGGEGKDWAQPRAAREASMRPRENARRSPGLGGSAEGRVRRSGEFGGGGPATAAGPRGPAIVRLGLIKKQLGDVL
jgi:hypothetical protein